MSIDLMTLVQWLSPAFPVGAFSYSHGLEAEVASGRVHDAAGVEAWLRDVLSYGAGRNDALLLAAAYRAPRADLAGLDTLAIALAPSSERVMETQLQGAAFAGTVRAVWSLDVADAAYPIAVGAAASARGLALAQVLPLFVQGFAGALCGAAMRLVPLGQTDGQAILARILPLCQAIAEEAGSGTVADLGSCAFLADIASMTHETQYSRMFRS